LWIIPAGIGGVVAAMLFAYQQSSPIGARPCTRGPYRTHQWPMCRYRWPGRRVHALVHRSTFGRPICDNCPRASGFAS
jgi:hypothetical protein